MVSERGELHVMCVAGMASNFSVNILLTTHQGFEDVIRILEAFMSGARM